MNRPLIALTCALCSVQAAAQKATGEEVVLDAAVRPDGVEFRVESGGCSHKAQFGVERVKAKPLTLRLVRLRPDYCEALVPGGMRLVFSFAELGAPPPASQRELQSIVIVNNRKVDL